MPSIALQQQLGVPETGQWDEATDAAFRARYGDLVGNLSTSIESIQLGLTELGLYDGPIDGRWSAELSESIRALQRQLGVPETGVVDLATLRALYAANAPEPAAPTTVATTSPPPPPPRRHHRRSRHHRRPSHRLSRRTPPADETLFDVLVNDGRFTTLIGLLESINYSELDRRGVYTVFAPTDDAFAAARQHRGDQPGGTARLPRGAGRLSGSRDSSTASSSRRSTAGR